ncbi:hypothetical protein [Rhodocyclus tenuis]|uniref:hypothetical protein n=1 Tax=Rhodocyclus tenuis TaxID=1066 RepID=UPI0019041D42|nr:hypothetical protein [Rhodocyclus tenuis]MBK1680414.1 hypothetical protein [Rhodocyclus tenuis]
MSDYVYPTVEAFPDDDRTWRLDWLGDIAFRRHQRFETPFMCLSLSPYRENAFPYPADEQRNVHVPVGALPILSVGSLWVKGRQVGVQPSAEETFTVEANSDRTRLAKAGIPDGEEGYLVPFDHHPFHHRHTRSWCLVAQSDESATVVIPTMEVIRFYFGSSSGLATRLLKPPFDEDKLWVKAERDVVTKEAHIDLAKGLSGVLAPDIARIAFEVEATHCARLIAGSLMASSEDRRYPKAHLPFLGKTKLRVAGMWLGAEQKRFLVFRILSCSHSLPFSKLTYTMTKKTSGGAADATSGEKKQGGPSLSTMPVASDARLQSEAPNRDATPRSTTFRSDVRFPDLLGKPVHRGDPTDLVTVKLDSVPVERGAVPDGEGKSGLASLDLVASDEARALPDNYPIENSEFGKQLQAFVADLVSKGHEVSFVPLSSRQRFPQISRMPDIVDGDGVVNPLSYVETKQGRRQRYVSVVASRKNETELTYLLLEGGGLWERGEPTLFESISAAKVDAEWVGKTVLGENCPALYTGHAVDAPSYPGHPQNV